MNRHCTNSGINRPYAGLYSTVKRHYRQLQLRQPHHWAAAAAATIPHGGHTAHLWVRDRHTHAASAGLRGVGAFAGGEAHLNVTRFKQQRSDSPATAYL